MVAKVKQLPMKILVETVGPKQFLDPETGVHVKHDRPSVARSSSFVQTRLGIGDMLILGKLKAEVTDKDFAEHWAACEGDRDLAIESFLSEFGIDAQPVEPIEPKKKAKA